MTQGICFIGAGNMAASLIGGLIANGTNASSINACDTNPDALQRMQQQYDINTTSDSLAACESADIVILAVKPQVMQVVCEKLASLSAERDRLFISIAAGVPSSAIDQLQQGRRVWHTTNNGSITLQPLIDCRAGHTGGNADEKTILFS